MTNTKNDSSNPALSVDKLITSFDSYFREAGIQSVAITALTIDMQKNKSTSTILADLMKKTESHSFRKLSNNYTAILEIVAEIVAELDEEPYFSNIDLPDLPEIDHNNFENLKNLYSYVVAVKREIQPLIDNEIGSSKKQQFLSAIKNKKLILDKGFFYEFTDGDLARILQIINELRSEISSSDIFEENHKHRLLRRLETLQAELHKKMSDVDRIWGLVGDAGIAIGKFGKNAKPFVDRIKELSQIAWRTQARAEELPSDSQNPLLERDK